MQFTSVFFYSSWSKPWFPEGNGQGYHQTFLSSFCGPDSHSHQPRDGNTIVGVLQHAWMLVNILRNFSCLLCHPDSHSAPSLNEDSTQGTWAGLPCLHCPSYYPPADDPGSPSNLQPSQQSMLGLLVVHPHPASILALPTMLKGGSMRARPCLPPWISGVPSIERTLTE